MFDGIYVSKNWGMYSTFLGLPTGYVTFLWKAAHIYLIYESKMEIFDSYITGVQFFTAHRGSRRSCSTTGSTGPRKVAFLPLDGDIQRFWRGSMGPKNEETHVSWMPSLYQVV